MKISQNANRLFLFRFFTIAVMIIFFLVYLKSDINSHFLENKGNLKLTLDLETQNTSGISYEEKIKKYGYQFEEHKTTTEDGYILTLWRIPGKLGKINNCSRAVILNHGLLNNAFTFFPKGQNEALPFILSDKGYFYSFKIIGMMYGSQTIEAQTFPMNTKIKIKIQMTIPLHIGTFLSMNWPYSIYLQALDM
jgi:hypothetical protein